MRNIEFVRRFHREFKAIVRLAPWLLIAMVVTFGLLRADLAATGALFQSPAGTFQSPASPTVEPVAPPTLPVVDPPTAEATAASPVITATVEVTPTMAPTVLPLATEPVTTTLTPEGVETLEAATETPEPTPVDESGRYAEGDSGLKFEWSMLFDSVALGLTYVWLACGALILLGIPAFFGILWLTSRRLQARAETQEGSYEEESSVEADMETEPFDE